VFDDTTERIRFTAKLIESLPQENRKVMLLLLKVFHKVWGDNDKLTQGKTLSLWAPVLLSRPNFHDVVLEKKAAMNLLRFMVEQYKAIETYFGANSEDSVMVC